MAEIKDSEFLNIVIAEREDSVGFRDEIGKKRVTLLDYYNMQPFGDEIDGQSRFVSSDVSDVVEGMLPNLLKVFTQGRNVARFTSDDPDADNEAEQKTELANYVFYRQNQGTLILLNMMKDALLQYTGTVKVYWDEREEVTEEKYAGLSQDEFAQLELDEETEIVEKEEETQTIQADLVAIETTLFNVTVKRVTTKGQVKIENIPPEEFIISRRARDFVDPPSIGHTTPKTRSELIQMGFDRDIVDNLATSQAIHTAEGQDARYHDMNRRTNASSTSATELVDLTEMYIYIDADDDGIAELWQVFEADNRLLEKNLVDQHPFATITPIPLPHRAIGSCPAEQIADVQLTKSVLVRQGLNNIYATNFQRLAYNSRVNLDDLLTPRPGGVVEVEGAQPIGDSILPIVTVPQVDQILAAVEYIDSSAEKRTGYTRFSQGLDADSLNHTATGFRGITEYSQLRQDLIARVFADTGIKEMFRKVIAILSKNQDVEMQIRVSGRPLEIDPAAWRHNLDCSIDVGLGSGNRDEKILNLNNVLERQIQATQVGSPLADASKIYNTLDKLIHEVGLKDVSTYFNDPSKPEELVVAENEQLRQIVELLQRQVQNNPLAEAEMVKAQARLQEVGQRETLKAAEAQMKHQEFLMTYAQENEQFRKTMIKDLTELELKNKRNVPGSLV